jgi:hypothetical protein
MPTRDESIAAAADVLSRGYQILYFYPIEEAARRAVRRGGPTYEELLAIIAEKRRTNLRLPGDTAEPQE